MHRMSRLAKPLQTFQVKSIVVTESVFGFIARHWWLLTAVLGFIVAGLLEYDPTLWMLEAIGPTPLVLTTAAVLGFLGFRLLGTGAEATVTEATSFARARNMGGGVIASILAFGTSLAELGFVVISLIKGEPQALFGAIVGSDGFNIGVVFTLAVIALGSSAFVAEGLRKPMITLGVMTGFVALASVVGFSLWLLPFLILAAALLAAWQFLKVAPEGAFDEEDGETDGKQDANTSSFSLSRLLLGFGFLLLGTLWLFNAIVALATVLGVPPLVIGLVGAIITSLPEIMVTVPQVMKGKMTLPVAAIAIAASNAFDTAFMALPAFVGSVIGSPLAIGSGTGVWLAGVVTMLVTLWLLVSTLRERISRLQATVVLVGFVLFLLLAGGIH